MSSAKYFFLLPLLVNVYRANTEFWSKNTYGIEWVVFTDDEGIPHYVNLSVSVEQIKLHGHNSSIPVDAKPRYWLYTRNTINDPEEILTPIQNKTNYIPKEKLMVLVHGWLCNRDSNSTQLIKNAILKTSNRNVIIVDWSSMQNSNYIDSAENTLNAAKKLGDFVQILANTYQISGSKMHFIGHSLGAHVVGLAGEKLKENNLIVSRVTGLDPARPFFEFPPVFPGISKDVGKFVDIIHTSIGILGICNPAGHADFYPGGGWNQSALCPTSLFPGFCEHSCAYIYFEKSYTMKFASRECYNYFIYERGLCNRNDLQYMGEPCKPTASGSYYLDIEVIAPKSL